MYKYIWLAIDTETNQPIGSSFSKGTLLSYLKDLFSFGEENSLTIVKHDHLFEDEYDDHLMHSLKFEFTRNSIKFQKKINIFLIEIL